MAEVQQKVDNMYSGSVTDIINGIHSDCSIEILNAIIAGTKFRLTDKDFISGVNAAKKRDDTLMGVSLSDLATASLGILGIQKYSGGNQRIEELIQDNQSFLGFAKVF